MGEPTAGLKEVAMRKICVYGGNRSMSVQSISNITKVLMLGFIKDVVSITVVAFLQMRCKDKDEM
jgi:hypothetical protein